VAYTDRGGRVSGLAGCSIEDATGRHSEPIYDAGLAAERVAAAVEAAGDAFVITARAENFLHGRPDLDDTIARLQSFQAAGAHVLYAPGITTPEQIGAVVASVERPVNVLALAPAPPVAELARLGVARISVGGAFAFAALGALVEAGRELLEQGSYGFWPRAGIGRHAVNDAFPR
jgi:2-methylisocitrate lyase-like PEP mutase family enzyme